MPVLKFSRNLSLAIFFLIKQGVIVDFSKGAFIKFEKSKLRFYQFLIHGANLSFLVFLTIWSF